jgi:PadR family transcriptional regulator PadR
MLLNALSLLCKVYGVTESDRLLSWETQLRKGTLVLAILSVLWEKERYGLEMLGELQAIAGFEIPEGTIYPLLSRLRSEGVVEARWVASSAGHPRKYYRLTSVGRSRLAKMAAAWDSFSGGLDMLLKPIHRNAE